MAWSLFWRWVWSLAHPRRPAKTGWPLDKSNAEAEPTISGHIGGIHRSGPCEPNCFQLITFGMRASIKTLLEGRFSTLFAQLGFLYAREPPSVLGLQNTPRHLIKCPHRLACRYSLAVWNISCPSSPDAGGIVSCACKNSARSGALGYHSVCTCSRTQDNSCIAYRIRDLQTKFRDSHVIRLETVVISWYGAILGGLAAIRGSRRIEPRGWARKDLPYPAPRDWDPTGSLCQLQGTNIWILQKRSLWHLDNDWNCFRVWWIVLSHVVLLTATSHWKFPDVPTEFISSKLNQQCK